MLTQPTIALFYIFDLYHVWCKVVWYETDEATFYI